LNRRIRNRTYGGVRGRRLIASSYSICYNPNCKPLLKSSLNRGETVNQSTKDNRSFYKVLAIICLLLIPIAASINLLFGLNRDSFQLGIMALSFIILAWMNWSMYRKKDQEKLDS
ncbi:hypothetical protein, partial [Alkalihalophilus marmarensis]|uniref:hypothetical protein n=1 Tax=Alkalihalophilus marmarensis TaxID=521377 RepID=UPI001F1E940B